VTPRIWKIDDSMGNMMEIKNKQVFEQAAVLPFVFTENGYSIYLITSLHRKKWILPKGVVESDELPLYTAVRETYEEAGLIGMVYNDPIGTWSKEKWGGVCDITVYVMRVAVALDQWPEADVRQRAEIPYDGGLWSSMVEDHGILDCINRFGSWVEARSN
jgi:8-oxo-dGTP pyrophosphatase MutT (NUDIX family)